MKVPRKRRKLSFFAVLAIESCIFFTFHKQHKMLCDYVESTLLIVIAQLQGALFENLLFEHFIAPSFGNALINYGRIKDGLSIL